MKYLPLDPQMFIDNRARFAALLQPETIALFHANEEVVSNADAYYPWIQSSDLFRLTGIDQPETILVLYPDSPSLSHREMLFIKRPHATATLRDGESLDTEKATAISGIAHVYRYDEFDHIMGRIIQHAKNLCLSINEHDRAKHSFPDIHQRLVQQMRESYPLHSVTRAAPLLASLRVIKSVYEINLMKQAVDLSEKMFDRLLRFVRPWVWEYEIEAEIIHEYIRDRGTGHSFEPIVASSQRACTLHYRANNQQCLNGEMLLIDSGAYYAHYASDMSRTIPINGRFNARQREVYNAVLRIQRVAKSILKPWVLLRDYQSQVGEYISKELVDLWLLTLDDIHHQDEKSPAYKKYCPHGISHFIGLDVHDVGDVYQPLQAAMVLSCEPGIYIPEEWLGIRLENEVMLTEDGCIDLMEHIPIEVEEIEEKMSKRV